MSFGKPALACLALLLPLAAAIPATAQQPAAGLRLEDVAVKIGENAYIDWHRTDSAVYGIQEEVIRDLFREAATEGAGPPLQNGRPAIIAIDVTYFDILSDLEKFFCCARNEVSAVYTVLDATSGETIEGPTKLSFDHVGRGGFLLLLYTAPEDMQLSRLYRLIADGTREWLGKIRPNR